MIFSEISSQKMKSFVIIIIVAWCEFTAAQLQDRPIRHKRSEVGLLEALANENEAEAAQLIENGENANILDSKGKTPMHLASEKDTISNCVETSVMQHIIRQWQLKPNDPHVLTGYEKIVRLLIEKGYLHQIYSKAKGGDTPLHWAAWKGYNNIVNVLLKSGSDVNAKNNFKQTPLAWATWNGNENTTILLLQAGSDINSKNNADFTPLHDAARNGNVKIAELLLFNGADITATNIDGKKPRDLAVENGHQQIVDLIDEAARNKNQIKLKEPNRVIETFCKKYSVEQPTDFILGGRPAKPDEFPWMAALGYLDFSAIGGVAYRCGGTIINEKFVLTAVHCTELDRPPILVRLGTVDLNAKTANNFYIDNIIRHRSYTSEFKTNDIALIRLSKTIVFTSHVRPACLNTDLNDQNPNVILRVTGWGSTSEDSARSDILREAEVKTMPMSQCNETYLRYNEKADTLVFKYGISESQYCAYDPKRKSDSCKGDSGSPLQIFRNTYTAHVIGIVSFGVGCGTELPIIYTRVAYFLDWIASHAWPQ